MYLASLKTPPYSNCKMLSPEGVLMCRIGMRKANWYTSRNLAKVVCGNPYTIQLYFNPNGLGNFNDNYYLSDKENICVVCGSCENLTKHHIIPKCFRKHFPLRIKGNSSHDLLLLCVECHEYYEIHASKLKKQIVGDVDFNEDISKIRAVKAAKTLVAHKEIIPEDKIIELMIIVENFVGDVNDLIIEEISNMNNYYSSNKEIWKSAVEKIDDLHLFMTNWRKHFIDVMQPKFLPEYWSVDRIH